MAITPYVLVGGGFSDSSGNRLSNGRLMTQLSAPATDSTGTIMICNDYECEYALDENGNVSTSPVQYILPTDLMTPGTAVGLRSSGPNPSLFYSLTAYSAIGELAWGPNWCPLTRTQALSYVRSEVLATPDGVRSIFPLSEVPNPTASLYLYLDGNLLIPNAVDYQIEDNQIFLTFVPAPTQRLTAVYDVDAFIAPAQAAETPSGTVDGGNVTFNLSQTPISGAGSVRLYLNGSMQSPATRYSISGRVITMTTAPTAGSVLFVTYDTGTGLVARKGEVPAGPVTGNNPQFTLSAPPVPNSLQFFVNGQELGAGDYLLAESQLVILSVSPVPGDELFCYYDVGGAIDLSNLVPANPYPA